MKFRGFHLNLWGINLKRYGQKRFQVSFGICVQVRVFLEIVYAFVIEKYQDYVTELATFKNYRPEVSILYKCQLGFSGFCLQFKIQLVTSEMYFKTMLIHPLMTFHGGGSPH